VSPERVDVCIVGSGFGGSVTAWRLAELYRAAGADPGRVLVLERGEHLRTGDLEQSMHIEHLSRIYQLIQGQGAQMVTGRAVGGGSLVYLAASLRAPTETFERRDRRPGDGPPRRLWPAAISRATLDPYYRRAERALRVVPTRWRDVSYSGGVWARTLHRAGHSCDTVPLAISRRRCRNVKWCHTGCVFGAKNTVGATYLGAAMAAGVRLRASAPVELVRQTSARPWRYVVRLRDGSEIECKVLVLAAGAMGTAPVLLRSRPFLPSLPEQVGRHLGVNGDHVMAVEVDQRKVREKLGLPGYPGFHLGRPITTMTYDFFAGRPGAAHDGTRFTLQEIFLSTLTNFLYDDGREPAGGASWFGRQKKDAIAHWRDRFELLAMVEDTHDGEFLLPSPRGSALEPNDGAVAVGTFSYALSDQSIRVREAADGAVRDIVRRTGIGRFLGLTQTDGAYAAHPLGGCRMGDDPDLSATDEHGALRGHEGLFCIDGSIVPTSLGVNPSLTIAAVAERCAEHLVAQGADLGLPVARVQPGLPATVAA